MSSFFSSITGGGGSKDNGGDNSPTGLATDIGSSSSMTVQQIKKTIHDEASIGQFRLLMDVSSLCHCAQNVADWK